jgi:RNA polymerase primary sigma factor
MTGNTVLVPAIAARFGRGRRLTGAERYLARQLGALPLLTAVEEVDLAKWIEAGVYATRKLATNPTIGTTQATECGEVVRRGAAAYERMIRANVRLAAYWARRRINAGRAGTLGFEDLVQEGVVGITHAVRKWDFTLGLKFSTYASHWIRHYQGRAAWNSLTVYMPEYLEEVVNAAARARATLRQTCGREPTHEEIAAAAGIDPVTLALVVTAAAVPLSLDSPVSDETRSVTFGDLLADPDAADPCAAAVAVDTDQRFWAAWRTLPDRHQRVLRLRLGLDGRAPQCREVVARRLGIAEFRVEKVELEAVELLTRTTRYSV